MREYEQITGRSAQDYLRDGQLDRSETYFAVGTQFSLDTFFCSLLFLNWYVETNLTPVFLLLFSQPYVTTRYLRQRSSP